MGCLDASGSLRKEIEDIGLNEIPEFKLTSFYDRNFLRQARQLAIFIEENDIKLIHTHDFYTNIFGMLSACIARVPARVASKRNILSKTSSQSLVERQAFRLADKILVNAGAVEAFLLEKGVRKEKIVKIFNGVDLERFKPVPKKTEGILVADIRLPPREGTRVVTIIANLRSEVKNHKMFLRSAKNVKEQVADVVFVIAGKGELTDSLKALAIQMGLEEDTYFVGKCADVGSLLAISDVCVLSSKTEGFSNSILEYMAAGKPVVATDVGGARESVIDGKTGYLVDSDNSVEMAARIVDLLQNPAKAEEMGGLGRQIVGERFSLNSQLMGVVNLYQTILSQKNGHKL